jgi:hypothetical protein
MAKIRPNNSKQARNKCPLQKKIVAEKLQNLTKKSGRKEAGT